MTEIKACIFDLDGVIVDTAKYHYLAWKELAFELGFDFSNEQNEALKGVGRMTALDILLKIGNISISEEEKLKIASEKNSRYLNLIKSMTPSDILPGVIEFLENLKDNNIKIALGSASQNAMYILEKLDIVKYFDAIIDGTKTKKAKPNPEVFTKGAFQLNEDPKNCIVFEDAQAGVQAAINGGMRCVGIGEADILDKANFVMSDFKKFNFKKLVDQIG